MVLSVGDLVEVLDENLSGIVRKRKGKIITIETQDGFELDFNTSEVVKIEKNSSLDKNAFSNSSIKNVIAEKESKKRKQPKVKTKERYQPTFEVDLHIHQLTNSSKRMTKHDMLNLQIDTARRQLDFAIRKRIQKMVFIHGVGEGILKTELEYLFGRYSNIKYYEADYKKYGLGATEVYIYQNVKPN